MDPAKTARLQLEQVALSYTEWPGEKGPIICLPSFTGHKGAFDKIAAALAPDYHLFALDLRGRGDSDKPAEGYGLAYHSRDILQFADKLGFERFSLIGHSFGATVGTYLASIRPLRVQTIVMMEGGADPTERVLEAIRPTLRHLDKYYPSMEAYLAAMGELPFYAGHWSETLVDYLRRDVERLSEGVVHPKAFAAGLRRDLDINAHYSMCLHFPFLQCPALFIRAGEGLLGGDTAPIFTEPETEAIVEWIPRGRRADVAGVNHYTMVLHDDPPVIPPIRAFLDETLTEADSPLPSTTLNFWKMREVYSKAGRL